MAVVTSADGANQFTYTPENNHHDGDWDRVLNVLASVEVDAASAKINSSSPLPDAATVQITLADGSNIMVQCSAESIAITTDDGNTTQYQLLKSVFTRIAHMSKGYTTLPFGNIQTP